MPWYRVRDGVSISGDLHGGDVFDSTADRFANHDLTFLLARGDIVEASEEDRKGQEALVVAPGLAKRIADEQAAVSGVNTAEDQAAILRADERATKHRMEAAASGEERADDSQPGAEPGAGDHDVAIQQTRGDVLQPAGTVPPNTVPPDQSTIDAAAKTQADAKAKAAAAAKAKL